MYITFKELPSITAGVTRVNWLSFALLDLGFCLSAACLLSPCDHGELLKCREITFFLQLIISIIILLGAVCGRAEHIFYYSQLFSYWGGAGGQLLCVHANQSASSKWHPLRNYCEKSTSAHARASACTNTDSAPQCCSEACDDNDAPCGVCGRALPMAVSKLRNGNLWACFHLGESHEVLSVGHSASCTLLLFWWARGLESRRGLLRTSV